MAVVLIAWPIQVTQSEKNFTVSEPWCRLLVVLSKAGSDDLAKGGLTADWPALSLRKWPRRFTGISAVLQRTIIFRIRDSPRLTLYTV